MKVGILVANFWWVPPCLFMGLVAAMPGKGEGTNPTPPASTVTPVPRPTPTPEVAQDPELVRQAQDIVADAFIAAGLICTKSDDKGTCTRWEPGEDPDPETMKALATRNVKIDEAGDIAPANQNADAETKNTDK